MSRQKISTEVAKKLETEANLLYKQAQQQLSEWKDHLKELAQQITYPDGKFDGTIMLLRSQVVTLIDAMKLDFVRVEPGETADGELHNTVSAVYDVPDMLLERFSSGAMQADVLRIPEDLRNAFVGGQEIAVDEQRKMTPVPKPDRLS